MKKVICAALVSLLTVPTTVVFAAEPAAGGAAECRPECLFAADHADESAAFAIHNRQQRMSAVELEEYLRQRGRRQKSRNEGVACLHGRR